MMSSRKFLILKQLTRLLYHMLIQNRFEFVSVSISIMTEGQVRQGNHGGPYIVRLRILQCQGNCFVSVEC